MQVSQRLLNYKRITPSRYRFSPLPVINQNPTPTPPPHTSPSTRHINLLHTISTHTYAVPTTNRFAPLASSSSSPTGTIPKSTSAASAPNTDPPKPKAKYFPPIVAYFQVDASFLNNLKLRMKQDYLLEFIQGGLKIRVSHLDDFRRIIDFLEQKHYEYYNFGEEDIKTVKFVIRGLPATTERAAIESDLRGYKLNLQGFRQMSKTIYNAATNARETTPLPLFVITIPRSKEQISILKSITGLFNIKIKVEDYKGRQSLQQCYRCQKFGHKASTCHMKEKCLNCAQGHSTRNCPNTDQDPPKCSNCGEAHKANFADCTAAQSYRQALEKRRTPPGYKPTNQSFPSLPHKPIATASYASASTLPSDTDDDSGLREFLTFFTSGQFSTYFRQFKAILRDMKRQPTALDKIMTVCTGLMDMFEVSQNGSP